MHGNKMNDCEKAKALILDRTFKIPDIAKKSGIPYSTLRGYVAHPEKLETTAWNKVYALAQIYDKKQK